MIEVRATLNVVFRTDAVTKSVFDFSTIKTQTQKVVDAIVEGDTLSVELDSVSCKTVNFRNCGGCSKQLFEEDECHKLVFTGAVCFCSKDCLTTFVSRNFRICKVKDIQDEDE